jgi:glycosyltransferase involved in cell wall biosynthesis
VVFATWAYPDGWAAVRLARRAGLPVVLKVHGSDVLQLDQYPGRRLRTAEALRAVDRVVVVSRDLAEKVIELGADPVRVHLVYNGVDAEKFHPGDRAEARRRLGLDPARPVVLYVGNLYPVKGPDVLIEACGRLAAGGTEFDLHVIGQGTLQKSLEARTGALGLATRSLFHGPLPHERLPDWFRAANLLVLPSRSEGVPNVLLEASACGTPYVATAVGGVPEIAHLGRSLLVPPENPARLADGIRDVLARPPAASAGEAAGRTHADAARELAAVLAAARHAVRPAAAGHGPVGELSYPDDRSALPPRAASDRKL